MRKKIDLKDILERALYTWLQTTLSIALVAEANWFNLETWRVAAIGGLASVLSMFKTVMVQRYGTSDL